MRRNFAYVAILPCLCLARDEVLACDNAALEYMGTGWSGVAVDVKKLPNGGDARVRNSLSTDSAVEVTFTGTGLAWRGWRGRHSVLNPTTSGIKLLAASNQGTVNIDIDGVRTDSADAHEDGIDPIDSPLDVVTLWSIRGLPNEQHVVKFNHGGASDTYLWIYQFISTIPEPPPPSPPPAPRPPPPSSSPSPAPSPPPARPTSTTTSREEPSSSSTSSSDACVHLTLSPIAAHSPQTFLIKCFFLSRRPLFRSFLLLSHRTLIEQRLHL